MSLKLYLKKDIRSAYRRAQRARRVAVAQCLVALLVCYLGLSFVVFAFRHPWLTQTQQILHLKEALLWQTIPHAR